MCARTFLKSFVESRRLIIVSGRALGLFQNKRDTRKKAFFFFEILGLLWKPPQPTRAAAKLLSDDVRKKFIKCVCVWIIRRAAPIGFSSDPTFRKVHLTHGRTEMYFWTATSSSSSDDFFASLCCHQPNFHHSWSKFEIHLFVFGQFVPMLCG